LDFNPLTDTEVRIVTWFKVGDDFYDDPEAEELSDAAVALWTRAGSWCSKHLTDGRISRRKAMKLCDDPERAIPDLVKHGIWASDDGDSTYVFVHWFPDQPSREQVMAERERNAARQQAWRDKKARERDAGRDTTVGDGVRNGVTSTVTNAAPTRPDPTRPDPPNGEGEQPLFPPPPPAAGEAPTRIRKLPDSHRFDEFWAAYPHKRDKDAARKAWAKVVRESQTRDTDVHLDEVIAGAGFYRHSKEFAAGMSKYPATFLNKGSWRDYAAGPPEQPGTDLVRAGGAPPPGRGFDAKLGRFGAIAAQLRDQEGSTP